jgi:hypothetical protein
MTQSRDSGVRARPMRCADVAERSARRTPPVSAAHLPVTETAPRSNTRLAVSGLPAMDHRPALRCVAAAAYPARPLFPVGAARTRPAPGRLRDSVGWSATPAGPTQRSRLELEPAVVLKGSGVSRSRDCAKPWVRNAGVNSRPVMAVERVDEEHHDVEAGLLCDGDGLV